jgi:hypothetical protein
MRIEKNLKYDFELSRSLKIFSQSSEIKNLLTI